VNELKLNSGLRIEQEACRLWRFSIRRLHRWV